MANSPARQVVDVGALIADTYTIEALLGRGGMGAVFLASHTRLPGKRVAIKFLHFDVTDDEVIARFKREAEIATHLNHPNIVRVDDFNVLPDGTPYLILEYLEGESLADRLKRGPMPLDQVLAIVRMIGSAIAAAHREGIIHRDLKPQNVFLVPTEVDGELVEAAKVLDFGISKMRGRETIKTQESTLLGTPQYMAPEQATGQHSAVEERTDVFALGSIVYEMLSGQPAFRGENIPEVVFRVVYEQPVPLVELAPETPPEVMAAVEKAMQKQQDDRFPTIGAFVEALTGRPLVQRTSMVSLQPGERVAQTTGTRAGQVAFANTIDSGKSPPPRYGETVPVTVSPHAETVASQPGDERSPVPVASRSRALVVALALTSLVGIAAAIFFATRGAAPSRTVDAAVASEPTALEAVDAAASAVEIDAVIATAADAAIEVAVDAVVATEALDAGTKPGKTGGTVAKDRSPDPNAEDDLRRAQAAYKAGKYELARQFCNKVTNSYSASPIQVNRALLLRGTIHCLQDQNVGAARADQRQMTLASYQKRLEKLCGL